MRLQIFAVQLTWNMVPIAHSSLNGTAVFQHLILPSELGKRSKIVMVLLWSVVLFVCPFGLS